MDGVPIDGWLSPADSDKLIIHNHFLPGNRYGYPGQLPQFGGLGIRNFGMSGAGNGDTVGIGLLEYRDVVGSVRYAKSRPDTGSKTTFLLSVCLGADSTCVAMARHPEEFEHIRSSTPSRSTSPRSSLRCTTTR
ncbi:alpha/beta hydrolase family protein [Streptomyces bauhiniae]|uniref:alpha/beta hydrolase family protein n=1 Tax=Streptomyces bauhiniae TaxID=2340725 RepID=UPI00364223F1